MQDFTKGGVQGKPRLLESAVTHHPFDSQPLELIRVNIGYCENLHQHSSEIFQFPELLFDEKINLITEQAQQFLPNMDISMGLPPVSEYYEVRVIPHAFLGTFYHLRNLLSLVLGDGSNQLKHYANMNPI